MKKFQSYEPYRHAPITTLKELLIHCAELHNDKTVFIFQQKKDIKHISFTQFRKDVESLGTYWLESGYKNCHIAVFGENSYEWILTHFVATCGNNVIVPIDKELDVDSIAELLLDSECNVFVYSNTYSDIAEQLSEKLPEITFINMNDIPECIIKGEQLIYNGNTDYINIEISKEDIASIVYTSGTTGKSKGVMLTHGNFAFDTYSACCNVAVYGSSILLLPLHHTFGLVAAVFAEMMYGYPIYICRSLKRLMQDFQSAKPQNFFAVPLIVETIYKKLWNTARKQGKDKLLKLLIKISNALRKFRIDLRKVFFKSVLTAFGGNLDLIICGGAPLNQKLVKGLDDFGITVLNGYGITECAPIVAVNRNKFNVIGSVGLPLECNEVKIADDGEILVKGDNVMLGYYHNENENKKVFVDGWFKTGDIGTIDEYGALHITGRIKNLIILSNGENISAESIEEQIYSIPYVKEAIAYGKDDIIVAEVYLDEEVADAKEMIKEDIQVVNHHLPQIKNIGKVIVRNTEFPKTTTKKIKRNHGGN